MVAYYCFLHLFRAVHLASNMFNDQSEQLFTREQAEHIINRSSDDPTNLPDEILEELENSSIINIQKNIKGFIHNLPKYFLFTI